MLLAIVTISYEQTIHAYPGGGGAYIVARDNLGELPAQIAGGGLLTDYILTVAVSVSSGVAQIASAYPCALRAPGGSGRRAGRRRHVRQPAGREGVGRGLRRAHLLLHVMMFLTVGSAFFRYFLGSLGTVVDPPHLEMGEVQALSLFLLLHAFSNGTTALTGVEAISNGITAFREPRSRNAGITLVWMSVILGIAVPRHHLPGRPHRRPCPRRRRRSSRSSRAPRSAAGACLYLAAIAATTLILIMAANTAYADFPRLSALQAGDGFLPRQLTYRGSRLVFSRGIAAAGAHRLRC